MARFKIMGIVVGLTVIAYLGTQFINDDTVQEETIEIIGEKFVNDKDEILEHGEKKADIFDQCSLAKSLNIPSIAQCDNILPED